MKCLGGPSPPCHRCRRLGAICSFEPPGGEGAGAPRNLTRNRDHGFGFAPPKPINAGVTMPPPISFTAPSAPEFSGVNGPPATRERNQNSPSKRVRLTPPEPEQNDDHQEQPCFSSPSKSLSPYAAVQDLEESYTHSRDASAQTKSLKVNPENNAISDCLARAGIPVAEAQAMFTLFGQRIAPYTPLFFETDFSVLPASPLFKLAAIHTIARYLPGSGPLRARTGPILRELLQNVLFDTGLGSNTVVKETLLGLAILYAYSEAGARDGIAEPPPWRLNMLTVKSIVEGYAVLTHVPNFETRAEEDPFWHLMWLWLYTMSHHCATLHGCVRTITSSESVYKARHYVDAKFKCCQIKSLVGEADLCLLWEHVAPMPHRTSQKIEYALGEWLAKWKAFIGETAEGRQLHFHYLFTRFALRRLVSGSDYGSDITALRMAKLDAGSAILRFISTVSPIVQDRLRYICDTAFVMLAFVGVSILGDVKTATDIPKEGGVTKESLLADVSSIAALLLSFGAKDDLRLAVYGQALNSVCEALSSGSRQAVDQGIQPPEHSAQDSVGSESLTEEGETTEKSISIVESHTFLAPDMYLPISAYDIADEAEQLQRMLDGGADNFMDVFNSLIGVD
ncbi:hypothetical protein BKA64DRAFT_244979 [Cadophora sp. MPI-SDFR-AT-0126]|nr:hypothetical protein BKA64DRAFT_244979 [Leotiomycetes sp. MPI-SDFR-AT-0126]